MTRSCLGLIAPVAAAIGWSSAAFGQYDLSWYTVDCGGGTSTGGTFSLTGTAGQPDAGAMSGGTFSLSGGFWAAPPGATCYPNCDNSSTPPVLNVLDFACFLNRFAAGCS